MKLFRRSSSTNAPSQSKKNRPRSISLSPSASRNIERRGKSMKILSKLGTYIYPISEEFKVSMIDFNKEDDKHEIKEIPNYVTDLSV